MIIQPINHFKSNNEKHIFEEYVPISNKNISQGALVFMKPGERPHTNEDKNGDDVHIHDIYEAFIIIGGEGELEIETETHQVRTGDAIIIEPGENHHLTSSIESPIILLWCHIGQEKSKKERK